MNQKITQVKFPKAIDSNQNEIHIIDAQRGRKGYICTGCRNEVEAVKPRTGRFQPYFRHVPKNVSVDISDCTWSNETFRHRIAKEILQIEKSVKVPRLLKYPPAGVDGEPKLIHDPRIIKAYRVDVEKSFYINNKGILQYGPKVNESDPNPDKHSLIVPDVIFFNNLNQPILFIELVATHDIDDTKLAKIIALKVDTISIRLPIESPEAIKECLTTGTRTKWIYCHERETAKYHALPGNYVQGVRGSDNDEMGVSYETSRCRKNRLGNLIRGIRAALGTDGFVESKRILEDKINSVNQELVRRRTIENQIKREISNGLSERREELQNAEAKLDRVSNYMEGKFESFGREIELREVRRTRRRRGEIKNEEERINNLIAKIKERYERKGKALEREESDLNRIHRSIKEFSKPDGRAFVDKQEQITREIDRVEIDIQILRGKMESLQADFEAAGRKVEQLFRDNKTELDRDFEISKERGRIIIENLSKRRKDLPGQFESSRNEIAERFIKLKEEALEKIKNRDTGADTQLSRQIKELVSIGRILSDYLLTYEAFERNGAALKFLGSQDFKTWHHSKRSI
jgi:hypothetical protein